jgi:hypothetical protein
VSRDAGVSRGSGPSGSCSAMRTRRSR